VSHEKSFPLAKRARRCFVAGSISHNVVCSNVAEEPVSEGSDSLVQRACRCFAEDLLSGARKRCCLL